jgi:ABC-type branched-subunit amino acid transport system permease subunit
MAVPTAAADTAAPTLKVPSKTKPVVPDRPFPMARIRQGNPWLRLVLLAGAIGYGFVGSLYWIFIIQMSFIMGIVALGTMIMVGYARETTLMQAGLTGSAIYISGWAYRENYDGLSLPFPVAALFGIGVVVAISVFVALISARLNPIYIMVLTLAVQFTIENSLFTEGKLTGGLQAPIVPRPNFFGVSMRNERYFYFFLLACTVCCILVVDRFRHCRFGRSMLAVGNDKAAAAAMGINPWGYKIAAFAMGGLFAGIGGALWAPQLGAPPGVTQFYAMKSLFFLAIPIFAGFESVIAVVGTGMLFMALPMALEQHHFQPELLGGVCLLLGVLMGPRGFFGSLGDMSVKLRKTVAREGLRGLVVVRPRVPRTLIGLRDRRATRELIKTRGADVTLWDRSPQQVT